MNAQHAPANNGNAFSLDSPCLPGEQRVAAGFIRSSDGYILFARRALSKKTAPGLLHLPGGHMEIGELPSDALVREIHEEFGVHISVGRMLDFFAYGSSEWRTLGVVYEAALIGSRDNLTFDPSDNCEVLWLKRDTIDDLFSDKTDHNYVAAVKGFNRQ
jgi:8-oxo-dGTP diphosphatase